MPECQGCGRHVTQGWVRVYGQDGAVYGCPGCSTLRDLREGMTAPPEGGEQA